MLRDLRLAARMLLQAKGWTAVVLLSLALGIGANTALFSAINGLLLKKLQVRDPDSLVRFRHVSADQVRTDVLVYGFTAPDARGRTVEPTFSYALYEQFVANNQTLSDLFAFAPIGRVNVVVNGQAEIAAGFLSTGNYYRALGVSARLGRTLTPDDDRRDAPPAAVISHKYWMTRFGGAADIVGTAARVNNVPVTIVGVLTPAFTGVEQVVAEAPDVALPLALESQFDAGLNAPQSLRSRPTFWWLEVMGRRKPGIGVEQVQANFAGVFPSAAREGFAAYLSSLTPEERARSAAAKDGSETPELRVDSSSRGIYDVTTTDRRAMTVLTAVVALVLLIVCANVANLLLSRATARRRELSVRLALGATRARLIRQLLTESLLLAAIGGAAGILVGRWSQRLLPGATGVPSPLDWRVLAFVIAVTALTGILFGIAPALRATRTDVNAGLKETSRTVAGTRSLLGKSLVVAQVAISLVLLSGAGLLLRTLQNLRHVDVGFNPRNVLLFQVNPALNRYDSTRELALYDQIHDRLVAIGGVKSAAWSSPALMTAGGFLTSIFVQGRSYAPGQRDRISLLVVSPTFFETMQMPLVAGRGFTSLDDAGAPLVVVINEAAARKHFPNESPIGRRVGTSLADIGRREIVGVLRDAKYNNIRDAAVPTMYTPYKQRPQGGTTFEVRTAGDPLSAVASVREAVRQVDPTLPVINMTTQIEEVERRFAQEKLFAQAYTLFGALALAVAGVGLFGLMSYSVSRRTGEIGIRMALGARGRDVLGLLMRESMVLVAAGVAIGLGAAIPASRLVAAFLYGLTATDPVAMAGAIAVMVTVSALAGYLPARRAIRINPIAALRYE